MANTENRFIQVYSQKSAFGIHMQILVDKVTGVNYLYTGYGYGGGLTPLLNSDGTPVVTPMTHYNPEK